MENLIIEKTKSSPKIFFDFATHQHYITGESYPENTSKFYKPVLDWIIEYLEKITDEVVVFNVELIYFNSSSSKILMDLFDLLDEACVQKKNISVNWIHDPEDEALMEYGEEFAEDLENLPIHIIERE